MHPSHYCTRTGNGQGMRMLEPMIMARPDEYAGFPESLLSDIAQGISEGATLREQALSRGLDYNAVYHAMKISGRKIRQLSHPSGPEFITMDNIRAFVAWCEAQGYKTKQTTRLVRLYSIQIPVGKGLYFRTIRFKDGKFLFGSGLVCKFRKFMKENSRSSDCVVTSETS